MAMAFMASMGLPPPRPTYISQPDALNAVIPASIMTSLGSPVIWSNTSKPSPARSRASVTVLQLPSLTIMGSVTTKALVPKPRRMSSESSSAPCPDTMREGVKNKRATG